MAMSSQFFAGRMEMLLPGDAERKAAAGSGAGGGSLTGISGMHDTQVLVSQLGLQWWSSGGTEC